MSGILYRVTAFCWVGFRDRVSEGEENSGAGFDAWSRRIIPE
jgi:hypothetical protein